MYILDTDHIGILQRQRGNEYDVLSRHMARHSHTEFHTAIVTFHAEIFDDLRAQKIRVSTMDLRIASIALATGMVVLSRNLVDFQRVPNLHAEDWTT